MVEAGHVAYTNRFHELASLVPYLVTPKAKRIERYVYGLAPQIRGMVVATELKTIQKAIQIAGILNDEALRNGSIQNHLKKRGNRGESSKNRNVRDDNKRNRTRNAFATTINPIRGGYIGVRVMETKGIGHRVLEIVIPTARVFCFCWQVFIPTGDLFLLALIFSLRVSLVVLLEKVFYHPGNRLERSIIRI
nr:reverse transcriptase domain-containing protein [Tanacetum cinerariifolium]